MAFLDIKHLSICGIASAVLSRVEENSQVYSKWNGYEQFVSTTGIYQKRRAPKFITSSDLCFAAAEKLIAELGWVKEEVEALVFVSQTPDYYLPSTSCLLQQRLGLPQTCLALDISLGCSGWVYAMSVITSLMQGGTIEKRLLLAGDTILKFCSDEDKSTYPLFGDAGTCTALEFDNTKENSMIFSLCTDGSGAESIIVVDGGARNQVSLGSFNRENCEEGIIRNRLQIAMDGMSVFTFGISKAPKIVNSLLDYTGEDRDSIDCFTFHQANLFMNEKIRKKLKLSPQQVPYSLNEFGNTSCASIPLTLVTRRAEELRHGKMKHIGCGFGVGLSWGAVRFDTDKIVVPEIIEL